MSIVWFDNLAPIRRDFTWKSQFWTVQWEKTRKFYELRAEYLFGKNERLAVVFKRKTDLHWRAKVYSIWKNPKVCVEKTKSIFVSYKDGQKWCEKVLQEFLE